MNLHLYDTKSRKNLEVVPGDLAIHIYCCGPTVYRDAHVGNLRTFLLSDLIARTLRLNGSKILLVQNITDVGHMTEDFEGEDKILSQSRSEKIDPFEVARKYEATFHADLALLNIMQADKYPKASECIPMMHDLIASLIEKKYAYLGEDNCVYFDARSFATYGDLSGNRLDALKPGYRFEYKDDGAKSFHADWALWKSAGPRTEMVWDSPWGSGFPGWHIECSAMSLHFLQSRVDIHVGGIDLRFPHHENERAQSNAMSGKEVVTLWAHGEHLLFEGRKMAKSTGNVVLLRDVINRGFDPLSLRLTLLENRYRSQMDLSWESISSAHAMLRRWRVLVNQSPEQKPSEIREITQALNDDLDTPKVIQILREMEKNTQISLAQKVGALLFADRVLGLDLSRQEVTRALPVELVKILQERVLARAEKNWARSDQLREELEKAGLIINDSPQGQEWVWR